ncbi:M15 family metallopeptidase [Noviherbaspirillum sp.]|uniref:M15 family metallopeptidase n=1 Tax=Noviherbaspirillum sp. TaxID=1926288 RepID=UPI0025DBF8CD|nr:M15 family metallopeptidase [Noviherbaspirillum sp.]
MPLPIPPAHAGNDKSAMLIHEYHNRISLALDALGIPDELIARKRLPFYVEASELVIAETDESNREYLLVPEAAQAWWAMKDAAKEDGVVLEVVSAFRSVERQIEIIRAKLARDMPIETILTLSAPPGYSEHHTGRAVDINTPGCVATEEPFEHTDAFRWLCSHADRFSFTLSYPRGNDLGFIYEPWHWCYQTGR